MERRPCGGTENIPNCTWVPRQEIWECHKKIEDTVEEDCREQSARERPKPKDISGDFVWSNGSFYILDKQIFDYIPPDKPSDFGKDIFPKLLAADKSLYGYPTNGYFVDVGNLQNLKRANETHVQR